MAHFYVIWYIQSQSISKHRRYMVAQYICMAKCMRDEQRAGRTRDLPPPNSIALPLNQVVDLKNGSHNLIFNADNDATEQREPTPWASSLTIRPRHINQGPMLMDKHT